MHSKAMNNTVSNCIGMVVIILMAAGTIFVFSAGTSINQSLDWQRFYRYPPLRQILFFPMACAVMYTASCFKYQRLSLSNGFFKSFTSYLLGVSIILLVLVLIPRFGTEVNLARRWFHIPLGSITVSFQPSELAKWATIFFLAGFCARFADDLSSYWKRFFPVCAVVGLVVVLIVAEDFGTAVFIALLAFLILTIAGAKWWHLLTPIPVGLAGFCSVLLCSPGRMGRITAFLSPGELASSANYQANQSLIALASGGILGKGLGRGICKYGHLPEDTTDFIFAIIGEELGFVGTAAVILLFIIFVWLGILVVIRCKDRFGQLLAAGIVLTIAIQAAINIGVVTVVLPTKGIPLPFVSAGGTSMLLSAAAVGILMNIAKHSPKTCGEKITE